MLIIRKAVPCEAAEIAGIYDEARAALKSAGVDQWQNGYPNADSAKADILAGNSYAAEENGIMLGTACIAFGVEPTYNKIYDGSWNDNSCFEYGFLHRVAVRTACKGRGVAGAFFAELEEMALRRKIYVLRGDTHEDNLPMQRALAKNGFERRGIVFLADGSKRLAYEKLLDKQ